MPRIHMPPGTQRPDKFGIVTLCQPFKDDPLYIDVGADGEFLCLPEGCFSPNLPIGFVESGATLGPYTPVIDHRDVLMVYLDNASLKMYATKIEIRKICPNTE